MSMTHVMHEMQIMQVYYSHDQNREEHLTPSSEHRRFLVVHNGNGIKKKIFSKMTEA